MISSFKRLWRDRRGNTLAIAGAALPLVLGSAGLASDTIQWTLWKRQLQRAADSAAMAGVYAIAQDRAVGTCTDIAGATYSNPVAYDLKKNNRVNIATTCTVTNPPSTGGFTSDEYAVRVALSVQKKLSFSGIFMTNAPTITAISTATIVPSGKYCVISLEDQATTGINASGATGLSLGCGMITNSTSMSAAVATGSANVTASPIAAVGGIPASDNWGSGTVLQPFTLAQEDPFANLPIPPYSQSDCKNFPNNNPQDNIDLSGDPDHQSGDVVCYKTDMFVQGDIVLGSAVYVLDSASLRMTNNDASLKCNGCTIILTSLNAGSNPGSIGGVTINGGEMDLKAPSTGTYAGVMIYQDRRAPANNNVTINGNNQSYTEGAFYFPRADLNFEGTAGMNTNCLQIVSRRVTFTGNSGISNVCPSGSGAKSFAGKKIRLVE